MPSPFPGMDPYLEHDKLWAAFHHQLVTCLYQILLPGLVDRYKARVGQRRYTTEQALFTSVVREEHQEEYIEIRQRNESRVVTLLDLATPTSKTTAAGKRAYLEKRREVRSAGANHVEIDLVRQGQPLLDYSREGLPEWDYAVTVTRPAHPDRPEVYHVTLPKKLPRFRMPLANDDRETFVDLQVALNRAYDQGGFAAQIDYTRDPPVPLTDETRRWLHEHLKQHKLRS